MAITKVSASLVDLDGGVVINESSADADFRVESNGNANMLFVDGGNDRVGIGTSSPSSALETVGGDGITISNSGDTFLQLKTTGTTATNYIEFKDSGGSAGNISYNHTDNYLATKVNGSERMRIDSNGNIAIGGTSASNFSGYVTLDLRDTTGGLIDFSEASAGVFARIQAVVNNSLNINNRQAYPLTFGTNDTERMRIDSSGNLMVGTTNTNPAENNVTGASILGGGDGRLLLCVDSNEVAQFNRKTNDGTILVFRQNAVARGSVSISGSNTSYNTTSDARLKDITGEARGLEVINELNPVAYNWKADGKADEGLIAQEVLDIVPNAVSGSEEEMYQMDYSKLVTPLIKAIQELSAEVEELKTKLESK